MRTAEKLRGFGVGLAMTGIAMISAAAPQASQGVCCGSCSQCYACGLTALPLLIWLATGRRRQPKETHDALLKGIGD